MRSEKHQKAQNSSAFINLSLFQNFKKNTKYNQNSLKFTNQVNNHLSYALKF